METHHTINDDDHLPKLSIADSAVSENQGTPFAGMSFPVTLDRTTPAGQSQNAVVVRFVVSADSAKPGEDYVPSGTSFLTFAPGETTKNIVVRVVNDDVPEGQEQFKVSLTFPKNALIADGEAIGTITD